MQDSEQHRLLNNIVSTGSVIDVDAEAGKMRLQIGENQTDWVKIPLAACGALKIWRCPSVGEQFSVLSESGNLGNAVPVIAIPGDEHSISGDADEVKIEFPAGYFKLDQETGEATLQLKKLTLDIEEIEMTGLLHVIGLISSDTDVLAKLISLISHLTTGVRSGSDLSGVPQ